ncbi:hypothetical protein Sste5346_006801 [Sporothrix stenoceras]|uniref:Uncharacterized protein n=1 Tax=Sporothrix stenoceras TaxID=5173 RepID=A0ABR3YXC6_9PEZI
MAGQLKRKRSDSELSFSSSTTLSSPPRLMVDFGGTPMSEMFHGRSTPLHLNSRTLKRYRNNRPSEAEVHERTLNLLYTAQHSMRRQTSPSPEQTWRQIAQSEDLGEQDDQRDQRNQDGTLSSSGQPGMALDCAGANQRSLHSFWNLARPQPASCQQTPSVAPADGYAPAAGTELALHASSNSIACSDEDSVMN